MFKKLTLPKLLAILLFILSAPPAMADGVREIEIKDSYNIVKNTPFRLEVVSWTNLAHGLNIGNLNLRVTITNPAFTLEELSVSCLIQVDGGKLLSEEARINNRVQATEPGILHVPFPAVVKQPERHLCTIIHYQLDQMQDQPHRPSPTP